jgi:hypothetical protein
VVEGFPIGVGGGASPKFFEPYYAQLQSIADTLLEYPLAWAIVTGGADGKRYRRDNDAKNAALALGRAHALRNVLVQKFNLDPTRIVVQSGDVKVEGAPYRHARVRIVWDLAGLDARLDTLANRPPVENRITEVKEITSEVAENMGLQLSAGLSSSPFGAIPIVAWAVTWKRSIFIEGVVGHTFWNSTFWFEGTELDTRRRMAGGLVTVYPFESKRVGFLGGWIRIEEISQQYYEYAKMSEGPLFGLRVSPLDYLSIMGAYNPAKHRLAGDRIKKSKDGQFLISITVHTDFGGGK